MGETVIISGEVNRVFSARSFTVGGSDFGQDLLVVSADPIASGSGHTNDVSLGERDIVQVTGTVQRVDPSTFEREVGVAVPEEIATEVRNEPVVALQSSQAMHGVVVSPRLPADNAGTVNELAIATDLDAHETREDRVAALPSTPIEEVERDRVFWVGTGENDRLLVVVNPESTPGMGTENGHPTSGEEWLLHGIFRELPREGLLRSDGKASENLISELEPHEVYLHALRAEPANESDS